MLNKLEKNTLEEMNPTLALDWHPTKNGTLKPSDVAVDDNRNVWWLCHKCGAQWQGVILHRSLGVGCPYCRITERRSRRVIN